MQVHDIWYAPSTIPLQIILDENKESKGHSFYETSGVNPSPDHNYLAVSAVCTYLHTPTHSIALLAYPHVALSPCSTVWTRSGARSTPSTSRT